LGVLNKIVIYKEEKMKKVMVLILMVAFLVFSFGGMVIAKSGPAGPAPLSGDGIPDGSGFEEPFGNGLGGAPNSGDGIPDGSGF